MAVRLKDVAEAAGVSIALVSNYVNGKSTARMSDETRSRIDRALRELDYQPNMVARFLRTGRSRTIGFLTAGFTKEVTRTLMLLLHEALIQRNWHMLTYYTKNELGLLRVGYQEMLRNCCEGVLVNGQAWELEKTPLPQVIMTETRNDMGLPRIFCDHRPGVAAALDHLISLGHRRVLFIGDLTTVRGKAPRLRPFLERFPADCMEPVSYPSPISPEEAAAILSRHPGATAAFCGNDLIALAFREALMRLGLRVPEDFSLVGFDNIHAAEMTGLSSVDLDLAGWAQSAVNALLNVIENRSDPVSWNVPARFVPRRSCAPPPRPGAKKNPR